MFFSMDVNGAHEPRSGHGETEPDFTLYGTEIRFYDLMIPRRDIIYGVNAFKTAGTYDQG